MTFNKQKWEKWARWVEHIKNDVQQSVHDHALFTEVRETVLSDHEWLDATVASYFTNFVARIYVTRASLGVRRHMKWDEGSLMSLLMDIGAVAPEVTFTFYLELFPETGAPWQKPASSARFKTLLMSLPRKLRAPLGHR